MLSFMNMGLVTTGAAIAPANTRPVRGGARHHLHRDVAGGPDAIIDHEIGAELGLQRVHDDAGK
jgi:hypothetical protein